MWPFKKWHTIRQTEPYGYPVPHKLLVLYPFTLDEIKSFWVEIVSWNVAGHFPKMAVGRFLKSADRTFERPPNFEDGQELYMAQVLFSGDAFRNQLIDAADDITGRTTEWYCGRFRTQMLLDKDQIGKIPTFKPSWQGFGPPSEWPNHIEVIKKKQNAVEYPNVGKEVITKEQNIMSFVYRYLRRP